MSMDWSAVDWTQLGEAAGVALLAAGSAMAGARRVLRKGFGELIRPVVEREVSRAVRQAVSQLHEGLLEGVREEIRATVRDELEAYRDDLELLKQRTARVEGALGMLASKDKAPSKQ